MPDKFHAVKHWMSASSQAMGNIFVAGMAKVTCGIRDGVREKGLLAMLSPQSSIPDFANKLSLPHGKVGVGMVKQGRCVGTHGGCNRAMDAQRQAVFIQ